MSIKFLHFLFYLVLVSVFNFFSVIVLVSVKLIQYFFVKLQFKFTEVSLLSVHSCALQMAGFAASFEMCSTVLVSTQVHESLYLCKNGFPYGAFLAFSCPVFSTPCNFVQAAFSCLTFSTSAVLCHIFLSHIFHPCSLVPYFPMLHFHVPHFQRPLLTHKRRSSEG